jgi:hypothetical protein
MKRSFYDLTESVCACAAVAAAAAADSHARGGVRSTHGGLDPAEAQALLKQWGAEGRYLRDVWS